VAYLIMQIIYKQDIKNKKFCVLYTDLIQTSNHIPELLSDKEQRINKKNSLAEKIHQKLSKNH
ncbi:DNA polymerase V subunit UmuC, partial [Acinetobacter guillouiae]|nr:DNA polymerase V subunit UmuC [Acinetobacter guillouiae]